MSKRKTRSIQEQWIKASREAIIGIRDKAENLIAKGPEVSKNQLTSLARKAEKIGLVKVDAMRNSGHFGRSWNDWDSSHGLRHIFRQAERALNILDNPNGYVAPSQDLYGKHNGHTSRHDHPWWNGFGL